MIYRAFGDLKLQVETECDTEGEEFISDTEMMNYFNSAVILCEATIVKLGLKEKYLQSEAYVSTVIGQFDYPLPSDIVINKIRKVTYSNQTTNYTLKPVSSESDYAYEDLYKLNQAVTDNYNYTLYKTGNIQKLRLIPTPQQAVTNAIRIIYFKSLQRYTADSDLCDLPDVCYEYLMSYVRYRIYAKESAGAANAQDEKQNMLALLQLMQDTMSGQIADPDLEINEGDFSHYMEMN